MRNYRGKTKEDGKWVCGYLDWERLVDGGVEYTIHTGFDGIEFEEYYVVLPETVGQQVGLKDKNGVEIYEGDQVKKYIKDNKRTELIEVIWLKHQCGFNIKEGKNHWYEKIGNIHDNPELLK